MPRVTFNQPFRFRVSHHVIRTYQPGKTYLVQQREHAAAIEAGAIDAPAAAAAAQRYTLDGIEYDAMPTFEGEPAFWDDGGPNPNFDIAGWRSANAPAAPRKRRSRAKGKS